MSTHHQIYLGDSRRMGEVGDGSVHLVVTSPPYWQLKDYGQSGQIGFDDSYEDYVNNLNLVWKECCRVLHGGCRLCVNIGDQFARALVYGRYKVIPIRTEIIRFCETLGLDYMGAVIWQKVTTTHTSGGGSVMGSYPYPRNGILKLDYEFILIFKKLGKPPVVEPDRKAPSVITLEEWNTYFAGHWQFPGEKQKKHLAVFPEELPRRLIKMFTFAGETVLDPFLGSGTTARAARNLQRNSIGYEINAEYLPLIEQALAEEPQGDLFGAATPDSSVTVQTQGQSPDLRAELKKLPYLYADPHRLAMRTDPRKLALASKVSGHERSPETYYRVVEVIGPHLIRLSDGRIVKLQGVKENPGRTAEAVAFLKERTKGQSVYLRDEEGHVDLRDEKGHVDTEGTRAVYLFLKNRTHLNAHLIKKGLAFADDSTDYRHRSRFLQYMTAAGASS